mmetsp:Transcript_29304/g.64999  ORF Transcript_29304/g.64999 Transcript_29304/m.64999 type:complete len:202 (-) Transcript_29304:2258-2863(-)
MNNEKCSTSVFFSSFKPIRRILKKRKVKVRRLITISSNSQCHHHHHGRKQGQTIVCQHCEGRRGRLYHQVPQEYRWPDLHRMLSERVRRRGDQERERQIHPVSRPLGRRQGQIPRVLGWSSDPDLAHGLQVRGRRGRREGRGPVGEEQAGQARLRKGPQGSEGEQAQCSGIEKTHPSRRCTATGRRQGRVRQHWLLQSLSF